MKSETTGSPQQEGAQTKRHLHKRPKPKQTDHAQEKHNHRSAAKSSVWLWLCIWGCVLFWEVIIRLASASAFWNTGIIFILVFSASLAALYTAVCTLLPQKASFITSACLLVITGAVYIIQMFYYSIFETYITAFSLLHGGQALQFGETIWSQLTRVWPWVLCMLLPLAAYIIFARKLPRRRSPIMAAFALTLCLVCHFGGVVLLPAFGTGLFSSYDYYYTNQALASTTNRLGLYTALRRDAQNLILGSSATPAQAAVPSSPAPSSSTTVSQPSSQSQSEELETERLLGPNVLEIDLAALAASETDATLADMHSYFASVEPTMQNEYTGMFEGYNLILVTAESFSPYAVDPELTPTLYKMMNEGMNFTNYSIPLWDTSTLDGEYAICQSLIPKQGIWSMMVSGSEEHTLPFTLGNQFLAQGYDTYAYHNHDAEYYNRTISHPNMGYTFKALDAGLELDSSSEWPESDLEMVDVTTDEFIGDGSDPFHVYYLTVSGHHPYETWNAMSQKNWDAVADLDLSNRGKAYLACNIELDKAMELLLERLDEAGIAEKTVIALTADHPPYPLKVEGMSELAGHEVDYQFEYYESTFFIYCQGMEPAAIDKPCSSLDILPTLSNLFALPYDSRLLMGRDIFSDAEPIVIFANRGWITDKARFSTYTGVVTSFDEDNPVDDEYVQRIHQIVANRFTYSAKIVETDYYSVLFPSDSDPGGDPDSTFFASSS